jgi:hypothetical protein
MLRVVPGDEAFDPMASILVAGHGSETADRARDLLERADEVASMEQESGGR